MAVTVDWSAVRSGLPPVPVGCAAAADAPFEAAIDAALTAGCDPAPERLVYADWLDELNTPEDARRAAAQRWMAANGKWPVTTEDFDRAALPYPSPAHDGWWFSRDYEDGRPCAFVRGRPALAPCSIPAGVFDRCRGTAVPSGNPAYWLRFLARRAAEDALADALAAAGVT